MNPFRRALRRVFGPRVITTASPSLGNYSGAQHSFDRTWLPGYVQGARQDLNPCDRLEMVRRARYFERNSALAQKILDLIETNVIGTGITVTADSEDQAWNIAAQKWWNDWCTRPDLTSRQSFGTLQAIIARAQAVDGEIFVYLTHGDGGRPCVHLIETQRVTTANLTDYRKAGYFEYDGVLFDQLGRPAFYEVANDNDALSSAGPTSVAVVPASSIVHVFEPARTGQVRGLTLFHSILHTLHDLDDLQRYEMIAAKDAASRANIVKPGSGEISAEDLLRGSAPSTESDSSPYYERAFGGKTVVLRPGDEWSQSESLRPSAAMREFWEYLTELCCKGVGISFAAVQDYRGQWGGAALRGAIASDNRFYQVRTDTLTTALSAIFRHAVGWAILAGEVPPPPPTWDRVQCHSPRRSTVDIGRESASILNELRVGLRTFRDVLGETGSDWRETIRQRIMEQKYIADTAKELDVPAGLVLGMLGAAANTNTFGEKAADAIDGEDQKRQDDPSNGSPAVTAVLASDADGVLAFTDPRAIELPDAAEFVPPSEFVWMPAGTHAISAGSLSGDPFRGRVVCDESAARAVADAFTKQVAAGQIPWIDFNHADERAAAWVRGFHWEASRGIVCSVEWTAEGKAALAGKAFRSFSPAFLVSRETGRVSGLIYGHAAGGLVNAPAFGAAMPALVAARLGDGASNKPAPGGNPEQTTSTMTKEQLLKLLAALKITAPADATVDDLVALVAKHNTNAVAEVEAEAVKAKVEADAAKKELEAVKAREADALAKLKAAQAAPAAAPAVAPAVVQVAAAQATPPTVIQVRAGFVDTIKAMAKESDSLKRGQIYRDVRAFIAQHSSEVLEVLAANSLGSMSGDLIVLRSLDLLKLSFPVLSGITTDFSAEQARQGQVIKTRVVGIPAVVSLVDATGWASSDVTTTDVSVTIGQPKGVQIEYSSTELANTNRDLFGEQVQACHYALAKDLVDALYAVITAANFTNATTKALASFTRADVTAMAKALTGRGVAQTGRTLLLNQDYYEKLGQDSSIVNLAAYSMPGVITDGALPPIAKFGVIEAVNLPTTGNLTGFGFTKDALVVATRIPEDYMRNVPSGAAHGSMSVVTNPDVGISVQKTDFVDHKLAKAYSRIAWAYGVAKGNASSGQRLISA